MFCRNCGEIMNNEAVFCTKCGVPAGKGNNYCSNCGKETHPEAIVCVGCGVSLKVPEEPKGDKFKIAAGLLGIFLGCFGVHNFYLGFTGKAVAQLLITLLTCGVGSLATSIWGLVEGVLILCGNIDKDAKGKKLTD